MLENTDRAIKNGQSRETGNIEYTRRRNWQHRVHKTKKLATQGTQDEEKLATQGTQDEEKLATQGTQDEEKLATQGTEDEEKLATQGTQDKKNKAVPASYKTPAVLLIYTVKCSELLAVIEKRKRIMSNILCLSVVLMSYTF